MDTLSHITDRNAPDPLSAPSADSIAAYLDYATESLRQRRDALVEVLQRSIGVKLTEEEAVADLMDNMRMAAALGRTTEDRRKETKDPFLSSGRTIDDWFKRFVEPLRLAMLPVQAMLDEYGRKRLEAERIATEQAMRQAQAAADRAAEAAAAEIERGGAADMELDRAARAAIVAEQAEAMASQRSADMTRMRGTYGAVASVRESWGWQITDFAAVPREYLMLNEAAVKAAAKQRDARGKPVTAIPGIAWVATHKMGIR